MSKELTQIIDDLVGRRLSRRQFIVRASALGLSMGAIGSLLTACGGAATPAATETGTAAATATTAPTEATQATATAAATETATATATQASTTGEGKAGGTIVIGITSTGETMNTIKSAWLIENIQDSIFDMLVTMDYDGKFQPGLADSWDVAADGLTYTFHLKKGVKFHDGTPFNSEAVAWWIKEMGTGPSAYMFAAVDTVETPDENTAVFKMKNAFPNLLYNLSTYYSGVPSPTAVQKFGEDYGTKAAVGTGPYKLVSFAQNDQVVLEKNPDYNWGPAWLDHQGPALPDKLVFKSLPEDSTRMNELLTGGIQVMEDIPYQYIQQFEGKADFAILEGQQAAVTFLSMNASQFPFDDAAARQAVNMAINKDAIVKALYFGHAKPAYGILSPVQPEAKNQANYAYKFDPAAAKDALTKGGWAPNSTGVFEKDGKPLKFTLLSTKESQFARLAEAIQKQLKEIGMDVDVQQYDDLTPMQQEGKTQASINWYKWSNADILEWYFANYNKPYPNFTGWDDKTAEDMLTTAAASPTWDERMANYAKADEYITKAAMWAPLVSQNEVFVVSNKVHGLKLNPLGARQTLPLWIEP